MSDVKITSNNQSGGITAQHVNASSTTNFPIDKPKPEGSARRIFWWVVGIAGVVSAIFAALDYFN